MKKPIIFLAFFAIALSIVAPPVHSQEISQEIPEFDEEIPEDEDEFEDELEETEDFEDFEGEAEPPDLEQFNAPNNPLRTPRNALRELVEGQMDDDIWESLLGELSCANMSQECLQDLQSQAVENSPILYEIDERVAEVDLRIEQARERNEKSVLLSFFTPVLQYYLSTDQATSTEELARSRADYEFDRRQFERQQELRLRLSNQTDAEILALQREEFREFREPISPLLRLAGDILNPGRLLNNVLSLVGINLFQGLVGGGNDAAQSRAIAIGDLQIRLAQMQRDRATVADEIRNKVIDLVLDVDTEAREFQITREIAKRDLQRLHIIRINYQYSPQSISTESYLGQLGAYDRQEGQVLRHWTQLRIKMQKLRVLVTGNLDFYG